MINRRGYMITPIIFIVFFLIAILFSFYMSKIDADIAQGIRVSASIEKGITDIYKLQSEQINFAKISAYKCSEDYCFSDSNKTQVQNCVNQSLNQQYGNLSWNIQLTNTTIRFYLESFNTTNINMNSDIFYATADLTDKFFKKC